MNTVNIQNESIEFLKLQVFGKCSSGELTRVDLNKKTIKLLISVWYYIYFGEGKLSFDNDQLTSIHQALSKFRASVTQKEVKFVNYIAQRINNGLDLRAA